ncbi:MAG: SGNH/GDSL hydrolase family protein [Myxococcales bacterium]
MPADPSMLTRVFVALLLLPACSSSDANAPGTGGSKGTGGMVSGSGGTGGLSVGTGGASSSGGAVGTGGDVASTGGSSTGTGGDSGSADTGGAGLASSGGRGGGAQGGTTGTGGTGGAAGAPGMTNDNYNPCPPAGQPCLVMPLGDSITQGKDGSTDEGGYRETLFRLAHAAGKSIQLVGSRTNGPATVDGVAWPRTHEGYSGYTIPALLKNDLTPNNIKTFKPNIVLLMIGTNDLSVGEDMPEIRLAGIVDTILNADPKLLLFVTQITPGQSDKVSYNQKVKTYNEAIPGIVSQRAAAGKHIRLMDMNTPFLSNANYSTALLANGVHPNDTGYKLMGQTWYAALSPLLH